MRALAEPLNLATVRVGVDFGLEPMADTLARLGIDAQVPLYPSLLLGADRSIAARAERIGWR